jgi:hypothetical protein
MEPSWQPDPTGRHHYRWWDGLGWGDTVADYGVTAVDPMEDSPSEPLAVPAGASAPEPARARSLRETDTTSEPEPERPSTPPRITVSTTPISNTGRVPISATTPYPSRPIPVAPAEKYANAPVKRHKVGRWIVLAVLVLAGAGVAVWLTMFGRESSDNDVSGVTTGELTGEGSFVTRDITLQKGEAIRLRVEGDPNRELVTYVLVSQSFATDVASAMVTDLGEDAGLTDSAAQILDNLTDADDVLSDGDVREAVRGFVIYDSADRCCGGVPDTLGFVAFASGKYRIVVVEDEGQRSDVRIIVEEFDSRLLAYDLITDTLSDDPFFTDTEFFNDTDPYEPEPVGTSPTDSGPSTSGAPSTSQGAGSEGAPSSVAADAGTGGSVASS